MDKDGDGNYTLLSDSVGEVETVAWYAPPRLPGDPAAADPEPAPATTTEPGAAPGYLRGTDLRRGELGTPVPQSRVTYLPQGPGGGYTAAAVTTFRNADGTGAVTTPTVWAMAGGPAVVTMTNPVVGVAQNGSGTATMAEVAVDAFGRAAWTKDEAGFLTYTAYDPVTGAVVKTIEDVDTTLTADFAGLPAGWATPVGGGLHRVTTAEVDALGRPTKVTSPAGRVDYTVYDDDAHEVRLYPGWDAAANAPTGPTVVSRTDATGTYSETLTMSATPAVAGGRPTGTEAIGGLQSLSRTHFNDAGQAVAQDDYFDLGGLTYSTAATLGTQGVNYYRTEQRIGKQGQPNRTLSPAGTITRTEYDGSGRVTSEWVGTDDTPTTGFWATDNLAGTDMVQVAAYEYDGGGAGDGRLTAVTVYPGGGASARRTEFAYDWRGRVVATKQGVETTEDAAVNRPITYTVYNNWDQVTATLTFDGDDVSLFDANSDGVPDQPAASLLRAKAVTTYDDWGRAYRLDAYGVGQTTGTVAATPFTTQAWYGPRGELVKTQAAGGLVEKTTYDGLGRPTAVYTTDGGGDDDYADALTATGDVVFSQVEPSYDADGNAVQVTARDRVAGETGTGPLGTPTTGVHARVTYAGGFYDLGGRLVAEVDVGTNGGTAWTVPTGVPARSDTALVTTYGYGADGLPFEIVGPDAVAYRTASDALGRTTSETAAYGTAAAMTTTYAYDSGGRLASATAPGGRTTAYSYDTFERVNAVTERADTALERTSTAAYNQLGETVGTTDALGTQSSTAYDVLGRAIGVTAASGLAVERSSAMTYDVLGRPLTATDPRGYVSTTAYDDVSRAVTATDALGHATTAAYDADGRTVAVTDAAGKTWTTVYDLQGRVVSTADPLANTTTYAYLVNGDTMTVTDPRSHAWSTSLDRFGRQASVTDPLSNTAAFAFDRMGRVTEVTDARGTATAYAYDALGRTTGVTEAVGETEERTTTYAFNSAGDLTDATNARGYATHYAHDTAGRVTGVTAAYGTADALTTTFGYDLLDRQTQVTRPGGRVSTAAYDALGQLTTAADGVGTALARSTTFAYDAAGNAVGTTDPLGHETLTAYDKLNRPTSVTEAYGTAVARTTSVAYDAAGRVGSTTNGRGHSTLYGYDDAGRRTSVTDANGKVTALAYDAADNLTSVTDPLSHATTFAYDAANRLTAVTNALSQTTTFGYDANGNRTSVTDPLTHATTVAYDKLNRPTAVTNALSQTTTLAYDANDNRIGVTNARSATWVTAFDALDRPTAYADPLSHTTTATYDPVTGDLVATADALAYATTYSYDDLGRRTAVSRPADGTTPAVTQYAYDADDNVVTVTDPLSHATGYGYDDLNRVVTVTDPLSNVTTFGYDATDNRTSLEDASGNVTTFAYDNLNRLTSETDPLGKSLTYAYDDAGRLTTATDRQGRQKAYGYDAADRPTSVAWYSAASSLLQTQTFGYDAAGNLTSATDPDGSYTIARDAVNRAATVVTPSGVTLTFAYDTAGNRTGMTDSTGGTQASTYDLANRLTSRTLDAPAGDDLRVDYAYTDRNEVSAETRYADTAGTTQVGRKTYAYDAGGRLTDLEYRTGSGAGTLIADYAYQYDLAGRLTQKAEGGVTTAYGYDALGQVTTAGGTTYSYDATGNRTTTGYVTGDGNRTTTDGTWSYTYDLDGNVVGKSKTGESWAYTYDLNGQMTAADHTVGGSAAGRVEYAYDAFGNRVGRTEYDASNAVVADAQYVLDGWDAAKPGAVGTENFDTVLDLNGTGNVTDRRLFGAGFDDLVGTQDAAGDAGWYVTDRLGSVRASVDDAGTVSGAATYDAFGGFLGGVPVDRYAFTGREWDDTLGLQFSRGRMYDPATGRWTGEDPIRQKGGDPNLYRYVGNAGTNATDPSGLEDKRKLTPSEMDEMLPDPQLPGLGDREGWKALRQANQDPNGKDILWYRERQKAAGIPPINLHYKLLLNPHGVFILDGRLVSRREHILYLREKATSTLDWLEMLERRDRNWEARRFRDPLESLKPCFVPESVRRFQVTEKEVELARRQEYFRGALRDLIFAYLLESDELYDAIVSGKWIASGKYGYTPLEFRPAAHRALQLQLQAVGIAEQQHYQSQVDFYVGVGIVGVATAPLTVYALGPTAVVKYGAAGTAFGLATELVLEQIEIRLGEREFTSLADVRSSTLQGALLGGIGGKVIMYLHRTYPLATKLGSIGLGIGMGEADFADGKKVRGYVSYAFAGIPALSLARNQLRSQRFSFSGTARNPTVTYKQNPPGTPCRTEDEARDLAKKYGVRIDDDIMIVKDDYIVKDGLTSLELEREFTYAKYFWGDENYTASKWIFWKDFFHETTGKLIIRVRASVFNSDEEIVAILAHEMHEINALRDIFASRSWRIQAGDLARLIEPKFDGVLHLRAWDAADAIILQAREQGGIVFTPNKISGGK